MNKPTSKIRHATTCFYGFDKISKRLIGSQLNYPDFQLEVMDDPFDADVCLVDSDNYIIESELIVLKSQLRSNKIPLILLTNDNNIKNNEMMAVIIKPDQDRDLKTYFSEVKKVFYSMLKLKLRVCDHDQPKQVYNRHLSNAINPDQIQFDHNRYYAQKYVGLNPDIDFNDEKQVKSIQLISENYLFHHIKSAFEFSTEKNKIACLNTVYGNFYVDAIKHLIYHDKTDEAIKNIHKISLFNESKVSATKINNQELNNLYQFNYHSFVWFSSIKASKGKIPHDINYNSPVKLLAWPDLPKLIVFKHSIRIISLWSRGIYSLKHTGKLLNIPQRYPLTVYTALHALGLISHVQKR